MINRDKEKEILALLRQFPVVAIIGPRQSGKTTLAKKLSKSLLKKTLYFDLESPADNRRFDDAEHFLSSLTDYSIIIDEVQRRPELFALLRSLVDRKKVKGKYLLLGSASPHLVQGVSESLAGRIAYCEITPFGLTEVYKKPADVLKHWFRGGFPDAWLSKNENDWFKWIDNFFKTFIDRDLNNLFGVTFSPELMQKLWRMLAHFNGSVWNASSFAKNLDVSPHTINRYIDYMEGAFMLRKLPAYFTNAKKRLVKSPKIYLRDSGILHYLSEVHSSKNLYYNPNVGNAWEGYVIEQICRLLPPTITPYYYRTHDGSEMDLVLVKGLKPILCIEIKTTNMPNISRGFYESMEDLKCTKGVVITPHQDYDFKIGKNVDVFGVNTFLSEKFIKFIK